MYKTWGSLALLGLLLLWPPIIGPAAAQVQTTGDIRAYGQMLVNYGVGCADYTMTGYLQSNGTEATPTTREQADIVYTVSGDRIQANADMSSVGEITTNGSGLAGSFQQTQTLDLDLEGRFANCPEEPFSRKYTGTQTLEGATTPGGGTGELKAYGEQTVNLSASCDVITYRPANEGGSGNNDSQSSGTSDASGRSNGGTGTSRLTLDADCHSMAQVTRTGAIAGTYTQTQALDFGPQVQTSAGPGVTGTTTVTSSQSNTVSTGD